MPNLHVPGYQKDRGCNVTAVPPQLMLIFVDVDFVDVDDFFFCYNRHIQLFVFSSDTKEWQPTCQRL